MDVLAFKEDSGSFNWRAGLINNAQLRSSLYFKKVTMHPYIQNIKFKTVEIAPSPELS